MAVGVLERLEMMRFSVMVIAAIPLFTVASAVLAASQHDWDACGMNDGQITSCTCVIQGGDEPTQNRTSADRTRGNAYYPEGARDRAIAGYIEMIRLEPEDPDAYHDSAIKGQAMSDLDRVIAHYDETIMLDPKDDDAYFRRGIANFYAGSLPRALADLSEASKLDPEYAYYALWLDILDNRNNVVTGLPQAISQIDMTKWPAPVIHLFLGQTTPAAVLAAADDPDANKKRGQVCEANFYSGEFALQRGVKEEAARLFRLAAVDCPRDFVERPAAYAELRALGVSP
jgi:lipoprotein NlpI